MFRISTDPALEIPIATVKADALEHRRKALELLVFHGHHAGVVQPLVELLEQMERRGRRLYPDAGAAWTAYRRAFGLSDGFPFGSIDGALDTLEVQLLECELVTGWHRPAGAAD